MVNGERRLLEPGPAQVRALLRAPLVTAGA
jgi:hypothetical protein